MENQQYTPQQDSEEGSEEYFERQSFMQSGKALWFGLGSVLIIVIIAVVFAISRDAGTDNASLTDISDVSDKRTSPSAQNRNIPQTQGRVFLESENKTVSVGDEFAISVLLDTGDYNINLANIVLEYDNGKAELMDIDTKETVMTISATKKQEPGKVSLARGVPGNADYKDSGNGFTGPRGIFAKYTFKAVSSGDADFSFGKDTTMYLDDGFGTPMNTVAEGLRISIK